MGSSEGAAHGRHDGFSYGGQGNRWHEQRLHDLRELVLLLDDSLSKRGVAQWFRARQRLLGGRQPIDVLAEGDIESVRRAAEAFADGSYV